MDKLEYAVWMSVIWCENFETRHCRLTDWDSSCLQRCMCCARFSRRRKAASYRVMPKTPAIAVKKEMDTNGAEELVEDLNKLLG